MNSLKNLEILKEKILYSIIKNYFHKFLEKSLTTQFFYYLTQWKILIVFY